MSFPTAVNNQITDAITQGNVKVLGEAPAMAIGSLYQVQAAAAATLLANSAAAQQRAATVADAATAAAAASIMNQE